MSTLQTVKSLENYLIRYGRTLGQKATENLDPLHLTGVTPLPDFSEVIAFNPDREPFDAQKEVIAASKKMMDAYGGGFIVGEMGCIAGESEVFDPVAKVYRRVDQITEPFHVVSRNNAGRAVIGSAHVPFIKGTRTLYRVKLSNGKSFVATSNHKMMVMVKQGPHSRRPTPKWVFVYELLTLLRTSGPVPLPSIEEPSPSECPQGAGRSSRTPSDSQGDCQTGRHFCDGPPRLSSTLVREIAQLRADAHGHNPVRLPLGAPANEQASTLICPSFDHPTRTRSAHPSGHTSHGGETLPLPFSEPCGSGGSLSPDGPRSGGAFLRPDTTEPSDRPASRSCCEDPSVYLGEFVDESVHVTEVIYERNDNYYDFTVDVHHNYVMAGVVHHNTGKTLMGMLAVHAHAKGKPYRAIVLCPDHLISKWCRQIEMSIPRAIVLPRPNPDGEGRDHMDWRDIVALADRFRSPLARRKVVDGTERTSEPQTCDVSTGIGPHVVNNVLIDDPSPTEAVEVKPRAGAGKTAQDRKGWVLPEGAEWIVLGRNQVKWTPGRKGMSLPHGGFSVTPGTEPRSLSRKTVIVGHAPKRDADGKQVFVNGVAQRVPITSEAFLCPRCGEMIRDKEGMPLPAKDIDKKSLFCEGLYLQEVTPEDRGDMTAKPDPHFQRVYHRGTKTDCDPVLMAAGYEAGDTLKEGRKVRHKGREYVVRRCREPLWQYIPKPRKWAPAKFVQKKMHGFFEYLVIDEVHEQKGDSSAQGNACGALIGCARYVLALTGTLIGGYADDLFPLMVRMGFKTIFAEGFEWKKELAFAEQYGRVDQIVTTKLGESAKESYSSHRSNSMRKESEGKSSTRQRVAPGIMPSMFGNHLIGRAVFLTLEQLAEGLPVMVEYVGGPKYAEVTDDDVLQAQCDVDALAHCVDDHGVSSPELRRAHEVLDDLRYKKAYNDNWFDTGPKMDQDQADAYHAVEDALKSAMDDLLKRGSMKLLGTFLHTTSRYPDHPYGWHHRAEVAGAIGVAVNQGMKVNPEHVATVGYWEPKKSTNLGDYQGVVSPLNLDPAPIRPKERALIDLCLHHKAKGNQVWVYAQMTGKTMDVQPRLREILEAEGLRVGVLRSDDVELKEREEWIRENGRNYDVMISYPKLVSTGLDLFDDVAMRHNFNVLVFYQTGYSLFDLRQASRRAWRIGQPKECFVYYLFYRSPNGKQTMQERAMQLMARKMAAAMALDGEFSVEGLAGMAGEDNAQMAMVKTLSEKLSDEDMQRNWGRVKSGVGQKRRSVKQPMAGAAEVIDAVFENAPPQTPRPGQKSKLDRLPDAVALVAATLTEDDFSEAGVEVLLSPETQSQLGIHDDSWDADYDLLADMEESGLSFEDFDFEE